MLNRFGMETANGTATPLSRGLKMVPRSSEEEGADIKRYQEIIGSLIYASITTRPDIVYTSGVLGRFSANLSIQHLNATKHVLHYLKKTASLPMVLGFHQSPAQKLCLYCETRMASARIAMQKGTDEMKAHGSKK